MTLAADVNANTPYFVAFKRNVGLVRNSSPLTLLALRQAQRIDACYHDPFVPRLALGGGHARLRTPDAAPPGRSGLVLIHTDHDDLDYAAIGAGARLVFDTRNATRHLQVGRQRLVRL